jgi:hypothetical protein
MKEAAEMPGVRCNIFVALLIGEVISEKDRCSTCRGKKVVNQTKILEVHIDKGMKEGQKIYFRGEGDQQVSVMGVYDSTCTAVQFSSKVSKVCFMGISGNSLTLLNQCKLHLCNFSLLFIRLLDQT